MAKPWYPVEKHKHKNFHKFINEEIKSDAFMNFHMRETLRILGAMYSPAIAHPDDVSNRFSRLYRPLDKSVKVYKSAKDVKFGEKYRFNDRTTRDAAKAKIDRIGRQIGRRAGWACSRYFWASKALNKNVKYRFGVRWTMKHAGQAARRLSKFKGRTIVRCSRKVGLFDTGEAWMENAYNNRKKLRVNDFSLSFIRDQVTNKYYAYLAKKFKNLEF